ncbi:MAG: mechanosensitive ion channel family protein [Myxococcales bacterium]|nr:mechanosensitive ion channel family protein [Myxococcales bacterium]
MLTPWLAAWTDDPKLQAAIVLLGAVVLAWLTEVLFRSVLTIFVQNTKTELDDIVVAAVRRPLFVSVLFFGVASAVDVLHPSTWLVYALHAGLISLAILLWTGALIRISTAFLRSWSQGARANAVLQPRTMPLFDMLMKVVLAGSAVYLVLLSWQLDVTGWLASAGIVGIAVGFAAKDTLANLFAGIAIIADAPYKIGDFIMFDDGLRGRVTDIGLRATRILTRDEIEINIPNQLIGNSRVVNETGGPSEKERVQVKVAVPYGADIDAVHATLLACARGVDDVCDEPAPITLLLGFGARGPEFALCAWIHPAFKEQALDALHRRVYKGLAAAGLEIPYSRHEVFLRRPSADEPAAHPSDGA